MLRALFLALGTAVAAGLLATLCSRYCGRWGWLGLGPVGAFGLFWLFSFGYGPNDGWQALGAVVVLMFLVAPAGLGWIAGTLIGLALRRRALPR